MPTVRKSALVPSSCDRMFALVEDVERYPEFLPWCASTEVLERTAEVTLARLNLDYHGIRTSFTTHNAKAPPHSMTLQLVEGPFKRLEGEWTFAALGGDGCKVELVLDYTFSSAALETLMGAAFGRVAETLVESFVKRASEAA